MDIVIADMRKRIAFFGKVGSIAGYIMIAGSVPLWIFLQSKLGKLNVSMLDAIIYIAPIFLLVSGIFMILAYRRDGWVARYYEKKFELMKQVAEAGEKENHRI